MKKNKIPPRIAANVRKYLGIDEQEKKYPHPDGYSNLLKCIADYRHIPKKDRFMFNRYGSRFYRCQNPYSKENKHEWYGPSMVYNVEDKEPMPFRVNDTMYAIVVFARDDTSTMVEFEFMRPPSPFKG